MYEISQNIIDILLDYLLGLVSALLSYY